MSLAIAFNGSEGIVLAADSIVTLNYEIPVQDGKSMIIPSTFDHATKLLKVEGQNHVAAVTYGLGALGGNQPRTPHSYLPEFAVEINASSSGKKLSVEEFACRLSDFFMAKLSSTMTDNPLCFIVGGFDEKESYGTLFTLTLPNNPQPQKSSMGSGQFGIVWGGQSELIHRLLNGFDPTLGPTLEKSLNLTEMQSKTLAEILESQGVNIPYQFLPLQDCVDLSVFLIRLTIMMHSWMVGVRGVGGAIDVATITRTVGYYPIQQKQIVGERVV